MTLLITILAAVISTLLWYTRPGLRELKISILCWMFWGAGLMWLVDGIFGFMESGADYFMQTSSEMINDGFLGFSAVALALVVWLAVILVKDPRGTVRAVLSGNRGTGRQ